MVSDFINGATEKLVLANQHHEIILIEGQGSISSPMFSGVTLGLLHGCVPDGLILCYEMGRENYRHLDIPIPPMDSLRRLYESIASAAHPCKVIGVGMNSYGFNEDEAADERDKVSAELALPVTDVIRWNAMPLAQAVADLKMQLDK